LVRQDGSPVVFGVQHVRDFLRESAYSS
jgi:hypothetical protein